MVSNDMFQLGMWTENGAVCVFFWYVTINTFFHTGFSALHWAVDGGHIDVVQYILREGVPVSQPMGTCIPFTSGCGLVTLGVLDLNRWTMWTAVQCQGGPLS